MSSLFRASRDSDEDSVLCSKRQVSSLYPSHYVASYLKGESTYGLSQIEIDRLDLAESNESTFLLDTFAKLFEQGHFDDYYFKPKPWTYYTSPSNWKGLVSFQCLFCIPLAPLILLRKFLCSARSEGIVISIIVSFLILILGLIIGLIGLIAMLPKTILNFILKRSLRTLIIHGYSLRLLKFLHIDITNIATKVSYQEKFWHSRFIDIRIDLYSKPNEKVSIFVIPQLADNYAFFIVDITTHECCILDCADSQSVLFAVSQISKRYFEDAPLHIKALLSTHKHWDHTAGNRGLVKKIDGLKVYGHYMDNVDCCTHFVKDYDHIPVSNNIIFEVISTPCHTLGSICYKLTDISNKSYVFTGDTVFHGACGAPFEGKEELMRRNFAMIFSRTSQECLLFPAHEYSVPLLDKLLKKANNKSPHQYFTLTGQYFVALHRRTLRRGEELPHIPIRLDVEMTVNPIFLKVNEGLTYITKALTTLAENRKFEIANDSQMTSEANLPTSQIDETMNGEKNYLVQYESFQNPFITFYRSDFQSLLENIRNGELESLEEKLIEMEDRMKVVPVRKITIPKNVFQHKEPEELDTFAKDIIYLRGRLEGFTEIRKILQNLFNYPMQDYMLSRLDDNVIKNRILKQRKPILDDWVNREVFVEALAKMNPNNRDIINEFIWKEGQFVPLIPLAMKLSGFEDADDLKAVTERLKFVKKKYKEETGKKIRRNVKSSGNIKVKPKGKRVLCSVGGFCKIRVPDLAPDSELTLPKPTYDLESSVLLKDSYVRAPIPSSTEVPPVEVQEMPSDNIV